MNIENEQSQLKVTNQNITHGEMAKYIMRRHTFITLSDTEEILVYNPKRGVYQDKGDIVIKQTVEETLDEYECSRQASTSYTNEVLGHIKRRSYVDRNTLNSKSYRLILKNGVLDLRTMKVRRHNSKYLNTIRIPIYYDSSARCPKIRKFLEQIVTKENVPLLEEIIAWCLDVKSPLQKVVLFVGEGANGKSTFLRLLRRFLGKANCEGMSLQSLANNKFSIANLYGKLANIYPDLSKATIKETGNLKALTGGDAINAERKYEKEFTFVNRAKLIFSANQPPIMNDESYALWRRMVFIEFPFRFSGDSDDKRLINKLITQKELSGLLNLSLKALKRLRENGEFSYQMSWEQTRKKYSEMSDPVRAFIEKECEFDSLEELSKPKLFQAYQKFCKKEQIPAETSRGFGRILKREFSKNINERANNWTGIYLKKSK
ncbi:phage/plasmid primase, P4 family [Chloroflexota bacterium]